MERAHRRLTLLAARFMGRPPMNLIDVEVTNGSLTAAGGLTLPAPSRLARGDRLIAGVRPERLTVAAATEPGAPGRVVSREVLGDETILVVDTAAGELHVRMPPTAP